VDSFREELRVETEKTEDAIESNNELIALNRSIADALAKKRTVAGITKEQFSQYDGLREDQLKQQLFLTQGRLIQEQDRRDKQHA
jgi:hypothetical protein